VPFSEFLEKTKSDSTPGKNYTGQTMIAIKILDHNLNIRILFPNRIRLASHVTTPTTHTLVETGETSNNEYQTAKLKQYIFYAAINLC